MLLSISIQYSCWKRHFQLLLLLLLSLLFICKLLEGRKHGANNTETRELGFDKHKYNAPGCAAYNKGNNAFRMT